LETDALTDITTRDAVKATAHFYINIGIEAEDHLTPCGEYFIGLMMKCKADLENENISIVLHLKL
jgi:hypothetical protein